MKKSLPVDCEWFMTALEFETYMRPIGKPLIIKGWMDNWQAMKEWTFDFFKTQYGKDSIRVSAVAKHQSVAFQVNMEDYIDYVLDPQASMLNRFVKACELPHPLYPYGYKPFAQHPELLEHFKLPPFVDDWFPYFSEDFKRQHYPFHQGWILIGPEGTVSDLHIDCNDTISLLAQITGRKRCILFSPEQKSLFEGEVDPLNPDYERFPELRDAQPYECILEPGSMLFLPPNWWHHVVALEKSITLSCNLVNHINFGSYLKRVYGDRVEEVFALLPDEID